MHNRQLIIEKKEKKKKQTKMALATNFNSKLL